MPRPSETGKTPKKPGKPDDRSARLAAALRANLQRRKAQARGRGDSAQTEKDKENR